MNVGQNPYFTSIVPQTRKNTSIGGKNHQYFSGQNDEGVQSFRLLIGLVLAEFHIGYYPLLMTSLHARFAGLTLLVLLLWGITSMQMNKKAADLLPTVELTVEHEKAAGISLTRTKDLNGPVDLRNDADQTLFVSVPKEWVRDEVRGAPITSIKGEEASLGFRRWSIPPHATVTFLQTGTWNKILIRNVSKEPLRLRVITVDISRGSSAIESILINDEALLRFQ